MEDVTNLPFRLLAKEIGGVGLLVTEFVSAMAIHYGAKNIPLKMKVHEEERPIGIQIFGGDIPTMENAARLAEEMGADLVDINMGCWVPKVCKTGAGAALLKDPDQAVRIAAAVVKSVQVPVTIKVRAGWDYSLFAAPELARRFQDVGVQAITLHARFARQGFDGEADWDLTKRLREAVSVPLIGNGDVKTPDDALKMLRETDCDGVMVGRAAISNPWALRDISRAMRRLPPLPPPDLKTRIETALRHLRMLLEEKAATGDEQAELFACRHLRGQIPMYIKGYDGAAALRNRLTKCSQYAEYEDVLSAFLSAYQSNP